MDLREIFFWNCRLDSFDSVKEPVASSCEDSNEPQGSVYVGEFLD
jgi:hypothetical protein